METFAAIFLFVFLFLLVVTIGPFVLMVAWNAVMPAVFGLPTLDMWKALALLVVFNLLLAGARSYSTGKGK